MKAPIPGMLLFLLIWTVVIFVVTGVAHYLGLR